MVRTGLREWMARTVRMGGTVLTGTQTQTSMPGVAMGEARRWADMAVKVVEAHTGIKTGRRAIQGLSTRKAAQAGLQQVVTRGAMESLEIMVFQVKTARTATMDRRETLFLDIGDLMTDCPERMELTGTAAVAVAAAPGAAECSA